MIREAKPPDKDPESPFCCGLVGEGPSKAAEVAPVQSAGHTLYVAL